MGHRGKHGSTRIDGPRGGPDRCAQEAIRQPGVPVSWPTRMERHFQRSRWLAAISCARPGRSACFQDPPPCSPRDIRFCRVRSAGSRRSGAAGSRYRTGVRSASSDGNSGARAAVATVAEATDPGNWAPGVPDGLRCPQPTGTPNRNRAARVGHGAGRHGIRHPPSGQWRSCRRSGAGRLQCGAASAAWSTAGRSQSVTAPSGADCAGGRSRVTSDGDTGMDLAIATGQAAPTTPGGMAVRCLVLRRSDHPGAVRVSLS